MYSSPNGRDLRLDVAWPKAGTTHPLVLLVHGGGWGGGDRSLHHLDTLRFVSLGYAAATIDYRLSPASVFPAALEDLRCAVRFLRAHAAEYAIDPMRVAAIGASAGGHLVSLLALAPEIPGDGTCPLGDAPVSISAAIDDYGPIVLQHRERYPKGVFDAVGYFLGGYTDEKAALASPITHLDAHDPPILVVHGSADALVPVADAREFAKALEEARVPHLYVELADRPHGFPVVGDYEVIRRSTCTAMAFLAATLAP